MHWDFVQVLFSRHTLIKLQGLGINWQCEKLSLVAFQYHSLELGVA
jgi:hypothetical protein